MRQKPRCLQTKTIASSRLFRIEQLDLEFTNGQKRCYERINSQHHGAVLVVAVDKNYFYLIREYAAGTNQYELAFPKGAIDQNEAILDAANRELREEIGFSAEKLTWLRSMSLSPGYFSAKIELVVAQGLTYAPLAGDEPETIEVVRWPVGDIENLLHQTDFSEARSIAALFLVKQWLEGKHNESSTS